MQLKHIERDNHPRLGKQVYAAPDNWKISALWDANGKWMAGIYNNDTRHDSQIIVNGQPVNDDTGKPLTLYAETVGQPITWGPYVAAAGECGRLIWSRDGRVGVHFPLQWASACAVWNDTPVVINWTGKRQQVLDCVMGREIATMPGEGIAMSALETHGLLVAAIAAFDDEVGGLSVSDGRLVKADDCQCVVMYCYKLLYSSGNRIFHFDGTTTVCLGELPCEKIMDMRVVQLGDSDVYGTLRIAGANPDGVWDIDNMGNVTTIGTFTDGNAKVGGSCFRVRASRHYMARAVGGTQGAIVEIV